MAYDISKSIPQGGNGEETEENRRILEVANELHRRCELYEAQLRDGQEHVGSLEVEQRVARKCSDRDYGLRPHSRPAMQIR